MTLAKRQEEQGAQFAPDGIPMAYGDVAAEYAAAKTGVALMDRSHEARIGVFGADRLEFIHRIATNDLHNMALNEGRGITLTSANARIIDRMLIYNRDGHALILTGPGRGDAVVGLLQRNIFFNDDAQLQKQPGHQFVLHGPQSDTVVEALGVDVDAVPSLHGIDATIGGCEVFVARRKAFLGSHWSIMVFDDEHGIKVWDALCEAGAAVAGAIAYNMIRIEAGVPTQGREISPDYIPLEVGLWDEVSFSKGCYTGQEIIARMESRARLARVMVRIEMEEAIAAPAELFVDERTVGKLTSSVTTSDGEHIGIAVIKNELAVPGQSLSGPDQTIVRVRDIAGAAPPAHMMKQEAQ